MKFINIIFSIILCFLYGYLAYLLNDLGILSNNILLYICIFGGIIVIFNVVALLKLKSKIIKFFLYIIGLIIALISSIGIYYLNSTIDFIDNFGNKKESFNYYYVIVLKESKYTKLDDLNNTLIGKSENLNNSVLDKIDINYKDKTYDSNNELINALYDKTIDAIVISDIGEYLIEEQDKDFTKKVRVVETIKIPKEEKEVEANNKELEEPFILYISGIDTNGSISRVSRSDVNIIVTVNPKTHQVLLTNIPRDYYVQLHGTYGVKDKLTHAGIYGIDMSVTTIEDLLGINIDYYARVNFDTVVNLVDQVGGITIYSDQNLKFCNIKEGYNDVDGKCALRFARERKSYATGDRHRGENQEEVIKAIINKVQTSSSLLTKYNKILGNLQNNFETNASNDVVKSFIKIQLKDMPTWNVGTINLDGTGASNYTYSGGNMMLYVMMPDLQTINAAKTAIDGIISGKTLNELGI